MWTETLPLVFTRGEETHECGDKCTLPTERIQDVECCPVSGLKMGSVITLHKFADDNEEDVAPSAKRQNYTDPLNLNGNNDKRVVAVSIFQKLFNIVPSLEPYQRQALKEAKGKGVNIHVAAESILQRVRAEHVTLEEQEDYVTRIVDFSSRMPSKYDFEALTCAFLAYQASDGGLVHAGEVLIAPDEKIKKLLPSSRQFPQRGLKRALISLGKNEIVRAIPHMAPMLKQGRAVRKICSLDKKRRRLSIYTCMDDK